MDFDLSEKEIELLDRADNEIAKFGKTNIRCSRCGNEIIVEEKGNSYTIKCKTSNCISLDYRGI